MTAHITERQIVDAIEAYTVRLEPIKVIAPRYGMTRQGLWKKLKKLGIDTSKEGARITVSCEGCGDQITRARSRVRKAKHMFCGHECYYAWLEAGNAGEGLSYKQNRHGQRIGRQTVAKVFDLQPGHIVHHKDRNCLNNNLENLMVFANQGDHTRHHRDCPAPYLFDGAEYLRDLPYRRQ